MLVFSYQKEPWAYTPGSSLKTDSYSITAPERGQVVTLDKLRWNNLTK